MSDLAVVRIRGGPDLDEEVRDTLEMLNLHRPNHCTIVPDEPSYCGMLDEVKEAATWGEINDEVLEKLVKERGEFEGGLDVNEENVEDLTSFGSVDEFVDDIIENGVENVEKLKKVFRLHPPKKGYGKVTKSFGEGGAKGYRGEEINDLILRMV